MKTGLIFSGQGAQAVGMGQSFYQNASKAREIYDLANSILGWDLQKICFEGPAEALTQTKVCQPALYVHGYISALLLQQSKPGLEISALGGLSLGELTALAVAGVYDFATGLKIVAKRGALMQACCESTSGAMAAIIGADRPTVAKLAQACDIDVANFNCSGQIVVSGTKEGVDKAVEMAPSMGIKRAILLKVAGAYHSRLMRPAADAFETFLSDIDFSAPDYPVYTNVTGQTQSAPDKIKANLVKQLYSSVKWEDDFRAMVGSGIETFYECGVGGVLAGLAKKIAPEVSVVVLSEYQQLPGAPKA